jgi:hypothetical protein
MSQISMHFGTSPKATLSIALQFLQAAYGAPVEWEFLFSRNFHFAPQKEFF